MEDQEDQKFGFGIFGDRAELLNYKEKYKQQDQANDLWNIGPGRVIQRRSFYQNINASYNQSNQNKNTSITQFIRIYIKADQRRNISL